MVNWSSYSNGSVANSSTLSVAVYVTKSSGSNSNTWGTVNTSVSVTDAGTQNENGISLNVAPNGSQLVFARNFTVPHNSDGKKSATISVNVGGDVVWGNGRANINLDTIPRQATLLTAPNFNDEENPQITFKNPGNFTIDAYIEASGMETIMHKNIPNTGSYIFEFTEEERQRLYSVASSNSLNVTFGLQTTIGSTKYWSFISKTMTIINANPQFNNFTFKDTNESVTNITGNNQILVKNLSNLEVTINSNDKMVAIKGSSAKKYITTIDNININSNYSEDDLIINIGNILSAGTKRLNVRAYDSRNNSTLVYKDIVVYDYDKPVINATVTRLNNFEAQTTLSVNGTYSKLNIDNVDKNIVNLVQYRYCEVGGDWSDWVKLESTIENGKFTCNDVILTLDNTKAFKFEIKVIDNLDSNLIELPLDIGQAIFFISSNKKACYINGQEILTYDIVDEW